MSNNMEEEKNTNLNKSVSALREESILEFWKENQIFEKTLEKDSPKGNYVFYDGPPFATGLPHYGHILGSTAKDVIGRYKTMQGYHVPRKWGWDCHGLPIENIVEKELGISGRKAIEEYGVEKFSEYARSKVLTYVHEWKKTVDRIGRFVDFDGGYKTMDNNFIESVWWALGELNKKELLYEGVRVLAYCTRCETPIANSEIAMDNSYKDISDISVYVKFELVDEPNTFLLAWTTTPWTLPGNTAIAINKDIEYVKVKDHYVEGLQTEASNKESKNVEVFYILAKNIYESKKEEWVKNKLIKNNQPVIVETFLGSELVGKSYKPVFNYYKNIDMPNKENIWKVWHADFVNADQGTGIAHEAPAFGEDDMNLAKENNIPFIRHVEPNGVFSAEVTDFAGQSVKPKSDDDKVRFAADINVIKYLQDNNLYFAKEKIKHSYPHCYRCDTPLLYYALPSWFVNIQKVKNNLLEEAKNMNWIPGHLKDGRFKNIMENAPDWTISRNRFWASPLPIWKSNNGKLIFVNSIDDLKNKVKKSGNKYLLMRHGEAENNIKSIWDSEIKSTVKLTDKGVQQVKDSAITLKDENIDIIICSPLLRTKMTAELVAETIGYDKSQIIVDERLREINPGGIYQGKHLDEFLDLFKFYKNRYTVKNEHGENYQDVKNRMMGFLYEIEQKYQGKNILIISHGSPILNMKIGAMGLQANDTPNDIEEKYYPKNAEWKELEFTPLPYNANYEIDLHRPYIDSIILVDENKEEYNRIPEVIDCWFESGSMPFAQDHYPFERPNWQKENFPAGFVAEYISQTRTWFYYTHALSTILFNHAPFENLVTTGTLLAEDGQKMSKSKGNYPDPWIIFDKFGVDALRIYLMSSSLMKGEDTNFSEKLVGDIASKIIGRMYNVFAFYDLYRDVSLEDNQIPDSNNILDIWIISRLNQVVNEVHQAMELYELDKATRPFELFIDDLSTWYLRRSRDRLKYGDVNAKKTLYYVLKTTAKLLAPFAPFSADDIWQKLKTNEDALSVHLVEWPKDQVLVSSEQVLVEMQKVRDVCTEGNALRKKLNIAVKQPLASFTISGELSNKYFEIIKDELNVKEILIGTEFAYDTVITPELKREGNYRELVRALQDLRKETGLTPDDMIDLKISVNAKDLLFGFEKDIEKTVQINDIEFTDGTNEITIDDQIYKISIEKF